jgi:hypothetical protein
VVARVGQHLGEPGVRGGVVVGVAQLDPYPEVGLDLVDVADRLAGEPAGAALQRGELAVQDLDPVGRQAGRRQLGAELAGAGAEVVGIRRRLGIDRGAYCRIAGVRVDETFLEPVEAQAQPDVLGRHIHTPHPGSCPTGAAASVPGRARGGSAMRRRAGQPP